MLRKLILIIVGSFIARTLYESMRGTQQRSPFPTASRPPEGYRG